MSAASIYISRPLRNAEFHPIDSLQLRGSCFSKWPLYRQGNFLPCQKKNLRGYIEAKRTAIYSFPEKTPSISSSNEASHSLLGLFDYDVSRESVSNTDFIDDNETSSISGQPMKGTLKVVDTDAEESQGRRKFLETQKATEPIRIGGSHNVETPQFIKGKLLSELCSWGIGGPAKYFVKVQSEAELAKVLRYCSHHGIEVFVVGKGSNCLFDDRGFNGCVILNHIHFMQRSPSGMFRVGGGYPFNILGLESCRLGFSGLEFAAGIPGTVGGAVYMNAGANQQETCDTLRSIDVMALNGERKTLHNPKDLKFGYRWSSLQSMEERMVVTAATFQLLASESAFERQHVYIDRRRRSQPIQKKTAGSVFRNPVGLPSAGQLIEEVGLKGLTVGGAVVSDMHANFIVNGGGSTSMDVRNLISAIKAEVHRQRGVTLKEEVIFVPFSSDAHL